MVGKFHVKIFSIQNPKSSGNRLAPPSGSPAIESAPHWTTHASGWYFSIIVESVLELNENSFKSFITWNWNWNRNRWLQIPLLAKILDKQFATYVWPIGKVDAIALSIALSTIVHTSTARIKSRMILMKWNSEYASGVCESVLNTVAMMNIQIDIQNALKSCPQTLNGNCNIIDITKSFGFISINTKMFLLQFGSSVQYNVQHSLITSVHDANRHTN